MSETICILGRQPGLGIAELESLFGAAAIQKLGSQAVLLRADPSTVPIDRLGGTMKVCTLLSYISATDLQPIMQYVSSALPQQLAHIPSGKITIGLSFYGFSVSPGKINAAALSIKKTLKSATRGVRIVPNKQSELNTAQVIHNRLTGPAGMELVFIRLGKRTALARTIAIQDIEAYAARDQARPARDARVGMLPPKLAQIIINLAASQPTHGPFTVLDPFCGTGVVLQEALLMGYDASGSDLEPRMIDYSRKNLEWLGSSYTNAAFSYQLTVGDATSHHWQQPFTTVACETYLGRPLASLPAPHVLQEIVQDVDTIHKKFLHNLAAQTKPGFRLCIAVPAWKTKQGFAHLPVLDHLTDLGYTRVSFVHVANEELIYHRPNQVVARELVTLIRN